MQELHVPTFKYYLNESDPDIVILRRKDGSFVAAFSARGATREGIIEAAREDHLLVIRAHPTSLGRENEEHRSA